MTDETSGRISIDDFAKIEVKVGTVLVAELVPDADKLMRLEVDFGEEAGPRQIKAPKRWWLLRCSKRASRQISQQCPGTAMLTSSLILTMPRRLLLSAILQATLGS